ncbi:MAG: phage holin family protein [Bacteroidales bacterium]|jgi:hypothetical protein|nr:phage holin family protein [Bacteroidales bacterium]MBQ5478459.1 phage holin family protein [Bacteroidaceae bacterium]
MEILNGIGNMLLIAVATMLVVFIAMMVDLASGLRKAKIRGELRSSQALKRTFTKFITYEGGMVIALCFDILIHMSRLPQLFGLEVIAGIPVIMCLVGAFLCVVEFISVREKADQKTRKQMSDAAELLNSLLANDNLKEMFRAALEQQSKAKELERESA